MSFELHPLYECVQNILTTFSGVGYGQGKK